MVSIHGYDQGYVYESMGSRPDLFGVVKRFAPTNPTSIASGIFKGRDTQIFKFILHQSGLIDLLDDPLANLTVFVPVDSAIERKWDEQVINNLDRYTARNIVLYSCFDGYLDMRALRSDLEQYINTRIPGQRLHVINYNETVLDRKATVIRGDVRFGNGIVHVVDDILVPLNVSGGKLII